MRTIVGANAVWSRDHDGHSGNVWKTSGTAGSFFVKQGAQAAHEYHRLRWLTGHLPVPTTAGTVMGQLLRRLHSLPVQECPFDARISVTVEQARKHVEADQVDLTDFENDHRQFTPGELLERLTVLQPTAEDLVVTHGDFTPANVLIRPDRSPVLIDVTGLGVADRYRDHGIAAFMTAYGLSSPLGPERQYWFQLLDEFF